MQSLTLQNSVFKLETQNICSFSLPLSSCNCQIIADQSVLNPLKCICSNVSPALHWLPYVLLQVEAKPLALEVTSSAQLAEQGFFEHHI